MSTEIKKQDVMKLLVGACPSYKKRWEAYLKDNYEQNEEQLLYLDISDFARHVAELHKKGQYDEFPTIFELVERLHIKGDEVVKEAATVGLLEDIQQHAGNHDGIKKFLLPESLKWWIHLDDFWSGKTVYVGGRKK